MSKSSVRSTLAVSLESVHSSVWVLRTSEVSSLSFPEHFQVLKLSLRYTAWQPCSLFPCSVKITTNLPSAGLRKTIIFFSAFQVKH